MGQHFHCAHARYLLYGTSNGYVGQMAMGGVACHRMWSFRVRPLGLTAYSSMTSFCPLSRFLRQSPGGVNCLGAYDILRDGLTDVLVGRDNGSSLPRHAPPSRSLP